MKKIVHLIDDLELLYYEYDTQNHTFKPDKNYNNEVIYLELITITHLLSSHKIPFFVRDDNTIVISKSGSLWNGIKKSIQKYLEDRKKSKMHIYLLNDRHIKWAKNIPIFTIRPIEQIVDLKAYDALIFTSKNAIHALNSLNKTWKKIPAYTIAPQTAKELKQLKGTLKFIGKKKHGNGFALELKKKLHKQKALYIRGAEVVSNLVNILNSASTVCDELIIYETVCKELESKIILPKNATIIFSSPSTIKCFLANCDWDESFKAIAIGKTTAQYFPPHIIPVVADSTSLESCVKKAIEINS
jgi:uroporphyrinogen-III synthase